MTSRDLTQKFKSIRSDIVIEQVTKSDNKEYIAYFAKMDVIISDIKKLQKDATRLLGKLQIAIYDTKDAEKNYKDKMHELDTSIDSLRKMFDMKKTICKEGYSKQDQTVIENMFKHKLSIFEQLIIDIQKGKMIYKQHVESLIPHNEIYDIFEANSVRHQNQSQLFETSVDEDILIEREKDIKEIVESINDLAQLFKDLSIMINSQSEKIDRIDLIMEDTVKKVDVGVKELKNAETAQKKCIVQ
jgi:hypothetical protein